MERGTVRVKCLAQEHNTMSPARARTRTARSGDERTNHEATAPPSLTIVGLDKYLEHHKLCKKGKKNEEIRRIRTQCCMKSRETMPENKHVAIGEYVASTDSESESDDDLL